MILENLLQWKNKRDDYYTASLKGKRDQIFLSVGKISDQDFSWTVNGNAGMLSGSSRSLEQAKATAEREARKILDSKYYNALETNFKWGPWKRGSDDRDYSPFVIQQYEREGTKDVGEFKDIPASQSRFVVIDDQGGHHEFDSRSDAMKYAEKSFKEWKKMQKTKKNSLAQKKLAVIKSNAAPEVKLKALEKLNGIEADSIASMVDELKSAQQKIGSLLEKYARTIARDDIDPQLAQKIKTAMGSALGKLAEASLGSKELAAKYKGAGR